MKSNRTCMLLDRYRDGELSSAERTQFESHLAVCENCRTAMSLLNNVVHLIRSEEVQPLDMADHIARQAFQRAHSWDYEVVSWLRPVPALAALMLMIVLFSSLWMTSGRQQVSTYAEYEKLMEEADSSNIGSRAQQARSNSDLVIWLEQEGISQ